MVTLRLAYRLAFSSTRLARWRQWSVIVTSFVAVLLVLLAAGVIGAAHASDQVIVARSPVWAVGQDDTNLHVILRGVQGNGRQIPVVWLEPGPHADAVDEALIVPPGLDAIPEPGTAVLSPGLLDLGYTAADFGLASSVAGTGPDGAIGAEGVISASDGWIYARPAEGRSLGEGGALLSLRGYDGAGERAGFETVPDVPTATQASVMVTWLLVLPALVLLVGGARAVSQVRQDRSEVLARLGVSRSRIRLLMGIETTLLAGTGVAVGVPVWLLGLSHLTHLPLTGATLHPAALEVPAPVVAASAVGLVGIAAVFGAWVRFERTAKVRKRPPGLMHVLPLVIAVAMMCASQLFAYDEPQRPALLFGGLLLAFVGLPLAIPVLAARSSRWLGHGRAAAAAWLAGRRLASGAWNLARPASVTGLLVMVAGASFALYAQMITPEREQTGEQSVSVYSVGWRDPRPGDAAWAKHQLTDSTIIDLVQGPDGGRLIAVEGCEELEQLAVALGTPSCSGSEVSPQLLERLQRADGTTVALGNPTGADVTEPSGLLIIGPGPQARDHLSDVDVMAALAGGLPAVNISPWGYTAVPPPTVGWLVAAWVTASLVLVAALIREIGDRTLAALSSDTQLDRLGLSSREIESVHRWTLFTPLAIAIPLGYVGAVAFAVVGYQLGYTVRSLGSITAVALAAGLLAATATGVTARLARHGHRRTGGTVTA